jgi:UDP-glucose 4-epimerase
VHTIETNVHGTEVVLKHANKKKKLVFIASTSEVYGKSVDVPFREAADLVLGPSVKHRWAYACSKLIDEFLALAYWKEKKLPVVIVRLFNTVGPRQTGQYGMVVPRFVRLALAGQPIPVYGDGTQRRSFTWVGDVVGAMLALIANPQAYGEVFNIGHTKEISIYELAVLVKQMTCSSSEITLVPYEEAYEAGFEDMDVVDSFAFTPNQAVVFVKTFNSWHSVRPMTGNGSAAMRKTLTINIEAGG